MTSTAVDPESLEMTARWTAAVRAQEAAREGPLVDDPWACELAGPDGLAWVASRSPESVSPIVIRTRFFDDWLQDSVANGVRQVVLLGAGLDTRAFRLPWPQGTVVFELDRPGVLGRKAGILERTGATARCSRVAIHADLARPWTTALTSAGFDAARPAAFLLEGLLFYLPIDVGRRILDALTTIASAGSGLGFDVVNAAVLSSPYTRPWVEMQAAAGAPWLGTMDDPVAVLGRRWVATMTQAGQPDASYGRWALPVLPTTMPGVPHSWLVTATRTA